MPTAATDKTRRIVDVVLDEDSVARRTPEVEHERAVALFDLMEENDFHLVGSQPGPYRLRIGIYEQRLVFDVRNEADEKLRAAGFARTARKVRAPRNKGGG